jgi:prepilin-type N-terminal cleavage/methylation domain-containing protein
MRKAAPFPRAHAVKRVASFTLIELLVVMAIIAILAGLILNASSGVWTKAARSRATTEIKAMGTALENYKTDNGLFPPATGLTTNSGYSANSLDGNTTAYQTNAETLYTALSGQTNYNDTPLSAGPSYMSFKVGQLGNATAAAGTAQPNSTYVRDPWGYAYGYSTGSVVGTTTNAPFNGWGLFDLWSNGGVSAAKVSTTSSLTNAWISNWQ